MREGDYTCGCSGWFMRFLTWATMAGAVGLSIAALESCELLRVTVVTFEVLEHNINFEDLPLEGGTRAPAPAPLDPYLDPRRQAPDTDGTFRGGLGVYKYYDPVVGMCLRYGNEFGQTYYGAGAAEGAARFFGTLATALGLLAVLLSFGLTAAAAKIRCCRPRMVLTVFSGLLFAASLLQTFVFILNSSSHCKAEYYNEFYSEEDINLDVNTAASCELGEGGWYALIAFVLYALAGLLVITKWNRPAIDCIRMDWTVAQGDDKPTIASNKATSREHIQEQSKQVGIEIETGNSELQPLTAAAAPPAVEAEEDPTEEYYYDNTQEQQQPSNHHTQTGTLAPRSYSQTTHNPAAVASDQHTNVAEEAMMTRPSSPPRPRDPPSPPPESKARAVLYA